MTDPPLQVGIIGLGSYGKHHVTMLTDLGHEVFGVDADPEARQEFERELGAPTYETAAELYERDIDAAIISAPNKYHETAAVDALENGLDVIIEKPLAHDLPSAERIARTARETERICMVGYPHRYRNVCQVARSYIEDGYFGDLTHVSARFVRRRGLPGRSTWLTSEEIAGGGAMMDIGSHLVDLVLFLCDWPELADVMATARSDFGGREDYAYLRMWGDDDQGRRYDVEDAMTAFCEFENGPTASIEVAWAANQTAEHAYTIRGTEAGAYLNITDTLQEVDPVVNERNELDIYEARTGGCDHYVNSEIVTQVNDPFEAELETFLEAVRTGERPDQNNVEQALRVQRVLDAVYRASE